MSTFQPRTIEREKLEKATSLLAELPDGTYTLAEISARWPQLMQSALQLCGQALAHPRQTTFHSTSGAVKLERSPARTAGVMVEHRRGDEIIFRIRAGQRPTVIMGRPFQRNT